MSEPKKVIKIKLWQFILLFTIFICVMIFGIVSLIGNYTNSNRDDAGNNNEVIDLSDSQKNEVTGLFDIQNNTFNFTENELKNYIFQNSKYDYLSNNSEENIEPVNNNTKIYKNTTASYIKELVITTLNGKVSCFSFKYTATTNIPINKISQEQTIQAFTGIDVLYFFETGKRYAELTDIEQNNYIDTFQSPVLKNTYNKMLKYSVSETKTSATATFEFKKYDNSIQDISMDIFLDNNGNAKIIEKWDCNLSSGTECYHIYNNIDNSQITNLIVSDKDKTYTTLNSWETSNSFDEKKYKCGLNNTNNGTELCWGISNYGSNVYTIEYNISNFVAELEDTQMIYWQLIPSGFSNQIENVEIKVYANTYIESTTDVWGYGYYGGLCYVKDGAIYLKAKNITNYQYMTLLAKLPHNMFSTKNKLKNNFSYYYKMAEQGTKKYEDNDNNNINSASPQELSKSIHNNMTYNEVVSILGNPDDTEYMSDITKMCKWYYDNKLRFVAIMFLEDKVVKVAR